MSDEPGESREWRFYIEDMLRFAEKVLAYTEGLDQAAFVADERTYDATLRNVELIGEAATHVPASHGARSSEPAIASLTAICTSTTA